MKRLYNLKNFINFINFKNCNPQAGFTFIELMLVATIMVILATTTINLLFSTLRGSTKDKVIQDVKLEGDRAMSQIENALRFASEVVDNGQGQICQSDMTGIGYLASDGLAGNYSLSGTRIASNSAFLTSDSVEVRSLDFDCQTDSVGEASYVTVTAVIGRGSAATDKNEEVYEQEFKAGVSLRKY